MADTKPSGRQDPPEHIRRVPTSAADDVTQQSQEGRDQTIRSDPTGIVDEGGIGGKPAGTPGPVAGVGVDTDDDNVIDVSVDEGVGEADR